MVRASSIACLITNTIEYPGFVNFVQKVTNLATWISWLNNMWAYED